MKRATLARLVGLLWALVLAGCATQPATDPAQQKIAQANKEAASQLFASESTVLHATEYPVASAAEGVQRSSFRTPRDA